MSEECRVRRYKNGVWEEIADTVSREQAFEVTWSGPEALKGTASLWAWPDPDRQGLRDLAVGHVLLECLPPEHRHCVRGIVTDTVNGFAVAVSSSEMATPMPAPELEPALVLARMNAFMTKKGLWDGTGCFHRAGIWLPDVAAPTAELCVAEDIGRHNCLDRLAGHASMGNIPMRGQVLFVTARVTASLYEKAKRMGVGGIVSRSAVSLHSVEAARRDNVKLIGFCRPQENRFTEYA